MIIWLRCTPPSEPRNGASPVANTAPSAPTCQYPLPLGVAAMPTTGAEVANAVGFDTSGAAAGASRNVAVTTVATITTTRAHEHRDPSPILHQVIPSTARQ